jgi:hypothetical protein
MDVPVLGVVATKLAEQAPSKAGLINAWHIAVLVLGVGIPVLAAVLLLKQEWAESFGLLLPIVVCVFVILNALTTRGSLLYLNLIIAALWVITYILILKAHRADAARGMFD